MWITIEHAVDCHLYQTSTRLNEKTYVDRFNRIGEAIASAFPGRLEVAGNTRGKPRLGAFEVFLYARGAYHPLFSKFASRRFPTAREIVAKTKAHLAELGATDEDVIADHAEFPPNPFLHWYPYIRDDLVDQDPPQPQQPAASQSVRKSRGPSPRKQATPVMHSGKQRPLALSSSRRVGRPAPPPPPPATMHVDTRPTIRPAPKPKSKLMRRAEKARRAGVDNPWLFAAQPAEGYSLEMHSLADAQQPHEPHPAVPAAGAPPGAFEESIGGAGGVNADSLLPTPFSLPDGAASNIGPQLPDVDYEDLSPRTAERRARAREFLHAANSAGPVLSPDIIGDAELAAASGKPDGPAERALPPKLMPPAAGIPEPSNNPMPMMDFVDMPEHPTAPKRIPEVLFQPSTKHLPLEDPLPPPPPCDLPKPPPNRLIFLFDRVPDGMLVPLPESDMPELTYPPEPHAGKLCLDLGPVHQLPELDSKPPSPKVQRSILPPDVHTGLDPSPPPLRRPGDSDEPVPDPRPLPALELAMPSLPALLPPIVLPELSMRSAMRKRPRREPPPRLGVAMPLPAPRPACPQPAQLALPEPEDLLHPLPPNAPGITPFDPMLPIPLVEPSPLDVDDPDDFSSADLVNLADFMPPKPIKPFTAIVKQLKAPPKEALFREHPRHPYPVCNYYCVDRASGANKDRRSWMMMEPISVHWKTDEDRWEELTHDPNVQWHPEHVDDVPEHLSAPYNTGGPNLNKVLSPTAMSTIPHSPKKKGHPQRRRRRGSLRERLLEEITLAPPTVDYGSDNPGARYQERPKRKKSKRKKKISGSSHVFRKSHTAGVAFVGMDVDAAGTDLPSRAEYRAIDKDPADGEPQDEPMETDDASATGNAQEASPPADAPPPPSVDEVLAKYV